MLWWKEIALLKQENKTLQNELEKEQGKASRLAGFFARLLAFGVSPTGQIPRRAFAETLMDTVHALLNVEQALLLEMDPETLELVPASARGVSPQSLTRLRVRPGEGPLGKAAQGTKTVLHNGPLLEGASDFMSSTSLIVPLLSQAYCVGLLVAAKPQAGAFSPEDRSNLSLLAAQAALIIEDHSLYEDLSRTKEQTVEALARALEAKDAYSHQHSGRLRALGRAVAQELVLPEILITQIEDGALLHDVGKIGIADAILKKPSGLTPEEETIMKTHSAIGRSILDSIPSLRAVSSIVLYHQEWYNGSGYPEGLAGEEIPLGARVVQILDAWDAMTSDRIYRKAMPKTAAIAELRRQAGSQFDPKLVDLFLRVQDRLEREGIPTTEQPGEQSLASQRA